VGELWTVKKEKLSVLVCKPLCSQEIFWGFLKSQNWGQKINPGTKKYLNRKRNTSLNLSGLQYVHTYVVFFEEQKRVRQFCIVTAYEIEWT
jgi:hypothetical protein